MLNFILARDLLYEGSAIIRLASFISFKKLPIWNIDYYKNLFHMTLYLSVLQKRATSWDIVHGNKNDKFSPGDTKASLEN